MPGAAAHEVRQATCWVRIEHSRESQMPANGTCRASSISYRSLSNCLVGSNAQGRWEAMLGKSSATPKEFSVPQAARAGSLSRPQLSDFVLAYAAGPSSRIGNQKCSGLLRSRPFCQHKKFTSMLGRSEQRTLCISTESAKQSVCLLFSFSFH